MHVTWLQYVYERAGTCALVVEHKQERDQREENDQLFAGLFEQ